MSERTSLMEPLSEEEIKNLRLIMEDGWEQSTTSTKPDLPTEVVAFRCPNCGELVLSPESIEPAKVAGACLDEVSRLREKMNRNLDVAISLIMQSKENK